jgi:hypothetical protein
MRKSHFNDEFLVLLGPIISRLFTCSNAEKTKGACSNPISMGTSSTQLCFKVFACKGRLERLAMETALD